MSIFDFRFSLFAIRFSLFAIRFSLFAIRFSLFAIRFSLFAIRFSLFNVNRSLGYREVSGLAAVVLVGREEIAQMIQAGGIHFSEIDGVGINIP